MSMQDKYDSAFLGILQNVGEISKFMDCLFSFLYRKTDFFVSLNSSTDRVGFPPGVAEKIVLSAFKKYESLASRILKRKLAEKSKLCQSAVRPEDKLTEIDHTEEVITEKMTASVDVAGSETPVSVKNNNAEKETSLQTDSSCTKSPTTSESQETSESAAVTKEQESQLISKERKTKDKSSDKSKSNGGDGDDDCDPELARLQKIFQANPESYNGAIRDAYSWSQSIMDVDVRVKVPKHIMKGKDVTVDIGRKHLKVSCKAVEGHMVTVVDGDLIWECHKDECVWSLVPGEYVHVNLEKVEERWWDALLTDESKINVRKIDPSRPMTDLDDEAQAKIEEMMYNEHQKRLGRPQSHENKVHAMLEKAWDVEGSPFRGQPFDPSKINVSSGGMMST